MATCRRPPVLPPDPVRYVIRLDTSCHAGCFGLLLAATLVATFLYLSELVGIARHNALYAALLATAWTCYFVSGPLLRVRVLGPALACAGRMLAGFTIAVFFGFLYWLIRTL